MYTKKIPNKIFKKNIYIALPFGGSNKKKKFSYHIENCKYRIDEYKLNKESFKEKYFKVSKSKRKK